MAQEKRNQRIPGYLTATEQELIAMAVALERRGPSELGEAERSERTYRPGVDDTAADAQADATVAADD